jgi:UDP-N-acetylglucosamine enolpyruvyl transferase
VYPRTNYEMTQAQLDAILDACKPTPVMFLSGGTPMGGSPQENANAAWERLGKEMGFDHMTVQPIAGQGNRFFTAVPSETETQREERIARQAEERRQADIATLNAEIAERQKRLRDLGAQ